MAAGGFQRDRPSRNSKKLEGKKIEGSGTENP